jgi:hypothetical protein
VIKAYLVHLDLGFTRLSSGRKPLPNSGKLKGETKLLSIYSRQLLYEAQVNVKGYLAAYRSGRGWYGQDDINDRLERQQREFMRRIKICKLKGIKITQRRMSAILDLSEDGGLSRGKGRYESARSRWQKIENAKPPTDSATHKVVEAVIKGFTENIYTRNDWKGGGRSLGFEDDTNEGHLMNESDSFLSMKHEDSEASFEGVTPSYWPYTLTRSLIKREQWRK